MITKVKNYSNKRCPDKPFGSITLRSNAWTWSKIHSKRYANFTYKAPVKNSENFSAESVIIIVLESPHIEEFDFHGLPLCPANGQSGKSIYKYFCDILNSNTPKCNNNSKNLNSFLSGKNDLDVWIVNSIQRQCSLGITPMQHIIKESNWIDEWFSSRNNFIKRINKVIKRKDFFIINLCTNGVYVPMKELVKEKVLKLPGNENRYCEGPHPSSWQRLKSIEFS